MKRDLALMVTSPLAAMLFSLTAWAAGPQPLATTRPSVPTDALQCPAGAAPGLPSANPVSTTSVCTATCQDGSQVTTGECPGTCTAVDSVCTSVRGYVKCNNNYPIYCPRFVVECGPCLAGEQDPCGTYSCVQGGCGGTAWRWAIWF